jgi:hypothetical protein
MSSKPIIPPPTDTSCKSRRTRYRHPVRGPNYRPKRYVVYLKKEQP